MELTTAEKSQLTRVKNDILGFFQEAREMQAYFNRPENWFRSQPEIVVRFYLPFDYLYRVESYKMDRLAAHRFIKDYQVEHWALGVVDESQKHVPMMITLHPPPH